MNETLGRGYARIDAIRRARIPFYKRGAPDANHPGPPRDPYNWLYIFFFIAGIAILLPYNSFVMAVDYFVWHYPDYPIMFDISTVYIASACVAVIVNNMLIDVLSYNMRINCGIAISLTTMMFVTVCNIGWDVFNNRESYVIILLAVGVVAFGCTIQQASYYGFSGCLPPRYTQAVMAGESAAGFWVSMDRIFTKYSVKSPRSSAFIFFIMSVCLLTIHALMHFVVINSPLVKYYVKITNEARHRRRIQLHLNPNEDATLMVESETGEPSYGVLKLQSPALSAATQGEVENAFSFSNPVYSPSAAVASPPAPLSEQSVSPPPADPTPRPSYKVEDVVYESQEMPTSWRSLKRDIQARWMVARAIYPYMVSIGLVYFSTLSLYPGIASEVHSCNLKSWMPVALMSVFNVFDLLGKIAAAWPYEWSRSQLLMASGLRLLLVPLLLLCAAPRHSPHIVGDIYPIMFSVALGFTNGLFGSVPMIIAPSRVSREHREIAGNMMTLSYNGGLLSGSLVSYLLLSMLGTPASTPCKIYPTPVLPTIPPVTMAPNSTFTLPSAH